MAEINYNPQEYSVFGKGMITVIEADTISDEGCVYAQNLDISSNGAIAPRLGKQLFGGSTTGTTAVSCTHTSRRRDAVEFPLRVRQNGSNGVLEYYYSAQWNNLLATMTANLTTDFADYVSSTYDRVYISNGVDDVSLWTMAVTLANGAILSGATTITVDDTTGFASSGKLMIGTDEVDYAGKTGTTFTTCTNVDANHADNIPVTQAITAKSSMEKGNILLVKDSHLTVAGITTKAPTMYVSRVTDPEVFTNSTPRLTGEGTIEDFPEHGGPITSVHEFKSNWVIFKEDLIRLFSLQITASSSGTGGSEEVPVTSIVTRALDSGAVNHKGTVASDNEIFYVSRIGGLKSISAVIAADNQELQVQDIFDVIRPTIADFDFSTSSSVYFGKKILVSCRSASTVAANDKVIVYDLRTGGIVIYTWHVSDWFVYNKKLYYGSSVDPNTYEAFTGYSDYDGTKETPIDTIWRSKRFNFGKASVEKETDLIYVEGTIAPGTSIEVTVRYDEEGSRASVVKTISGDPSNDYIVETPVNMFGNNALGAEPFAGLVSQGSDLNKFRVYLTMPAEYSAFNMDIQFRTNTIGSRWKITNFAVNPVLREEPPAHLKL